MEIQSSWPLFLTWAIRIKVLIKQQFLRRSHWQGQFCPADPTRKWDRKEGSWGCLVWRQQQLWGTWEEVTEDGEWDRSQTGTGNSWLKRPFFPSEDDKALEQSPRAAIKPSALGVFKISLARPWANWSSSRLIWLWAWGWSGCCPRSLTLNNSAI